MKNVFLLYLFLSLFFYKFNCSNKKKLIYGILTSLIGISLGNIYNYKKIKDIKNKQLIDQKINQLTFNKKDFKFNKKNFIENTLSLIKKILFFNVNVFSFIHLKNKLKLFTIELIKNKYENFDIKNILIKKINNDKIKELTILLNKLKIDKKNPLISKNQKILENIQKAELTINNSLNIINNEIEDNKKTFNINEKQYKQIKFTNIENELNSLENAVEQIIAYPKAIISLKDANFENLGLNLIEIQGMKSQNIQEITRQENLLISSNIDFICTKNNIFKKLNNIKILENLIDIKNENKMFETFYARFKTILIKYNQNIYNLEIILNKDINKPDENESFLEVINNILFFNIISKKDLIINKSILLLNINKNLQQIFNNYIQPIKEIKFIKKNNNLYEITTLFIEDLKIEDIIKNLNQKYLYEIENLIQAENIFNSQDHALNNNDAQYMFIQQNTKFQISVYLDENLILQ